MNRLPTPIHKQIEVLPALPATVTEVMNLTADPESSAHDLMRAILPDQSICTAVLKLANSAFFGIPRNVATLEKAVMVLGFDEVRNIVLGKAVFNSFRGVYRNNRETIELFWEHSFLCGLAAKIIAEHESYPASELFIAGLTHDIGKLVMLMSLERQYADILALSDPTEFVGYMRELEAFSVSHDDVARRLLNRWLFPPSLTDAIGYHHKPQECPGDQIPALIVQVSDILALMHAHPHDTLTDVVAIIDDFLPEIKSLWRHNKLAWERDLLARWREELRLSSSRDHAVLDILIS